MVRVASSGWRTMLPNIVPLTNGFIQMWRSHCVHRFWCILAAHSIVLTFGQFQASAALLNLIPFVKKKRPYPHGLLTAIS